MKKQDCGCSKPKSIFNLDNPRHKPCQNLPGLRVMYSRETNLLMMLYAVLIICVPVLIVELLQWLTNG